LGWELLGLELRGGFGSEEGDGLEGWLRSGVGVGRSTLLPPPVGAPAALTPGMLLASVGAPSKAGRDCGSRTTTPARLCNECGLSPVKRMTENERRARRVREKTVRTRPVGEHERRIVWKRLDNERDVRNVVQRL
jgi:hypothetical protein